MKSPSVENIVQAWLKENNYDGLCDPVTECGCTIDDFAPCGDGPFAECKAAYRKNKGRFWEMVLEKPEKENDNEN